MAVGIIYDGDQVDSLMRQDITIERLEAIRGGTAGVLTVNGPASIVNFITRKGTAEASGKVRVSVSDYRTKNALTFRVTPTLHTEYGDLFLVYHYLGGRFADIANTVRLPSYSTIAVGAVIDITESIALQIKGTNLTNAVGLTEGNPRSGFSEQPATQFFYARPILGRTVKAVTSKPDGNIETLILADERVISGDVFIDCTGFLSLLIEKHYKTDFTNMGHILLCDKALAFQIPCDEDDYQIKSYTIATAQTAGWIWDIGLKNRRGTGYVYSSTHQSADEAEAVYRKYIGPKADNMPIRTLDMNIGYRKTQWVNNCIAIGLSGGFLEPLESTGIHMIEVALPMLVQMLPRYFKGGEPQKRYNEIMKNQYEIVETPVSLTNNKVTWSRDRLDGQGGVYALC